MCWKKKKIKKISTILYRVRTQRVYRSVFPMTFIRFARFLVTSPARRKNKTVGNTKICYSNNPCRRNYSLKTNGRGPSRSRVERSAKCNHVETMKLSTSRPLSRPPNGLNRRTKTSVLTLFISLTFSFPD
jgi:hypothetical protein